MKCGYCGHWNNKDNKNCSACNHQLQGNPKLSKANLDDTKVYSKDLYSNTISIDNKLLQKVKKEKKTFNKKILLYPLFVIIIVLLLFLICFGIKTIFSKKVYEHGDISLKVNSYETSDIVNSSTYYKISGYSDLTYNILSGKSNGNEYKILLFKNDSNNYYHVTLSPHIGDNSDLAFNIIDVEPNSSKPMIFKYKDTGDTFSVSNLNVSKNTTNSKSTKFLYNFVDYEYLNNNLRLYFKYSGKKDDISNSNLILLYLKDNSIVGYSSNIKLSKENNDKEVTKDNLVYIDLGNNISYDEIIYLGYSYTK